MIMNLEYIDILDQADHLAEMIKKSDVMQSYTEAKRAMDENEETQRLIRAFNDIKGHYEDVQRFGRYHPDYSHIMKEVRAIKRQMDMDDYVAAYKVAERNYQRLLDEISENIAFSVSEQIMVPKDGAALSDTGCAGGCGSGGSCSCEAS